MLTTDDDDIKSLRRALDDAMRLSDERFARLLECGKGYDELLRRFEKLKGFIEFYTICCCCEEPMTCHPECTFKEDCPTDHETMIQARAALYDY